MKKLLFILIITSSFVSAQNKESNARNTIKNAEIGLIKKDWSNILEFEVKGGKEHIRFFPVEVTNLNSNITLKALEFDFDVSKSKRVYNDEIKELIIFLDSYVIPNLQMVEDKKKSTEYFFDSEELYLTFYLKNGKKYFDIYPKDDLGFVLWQNGFSIEKEKDFKRLQELVFMLKYIIK